MRLLALLTTVLTCTSLVVACPDAQGFGVGTANGLSDVISNCVPQAPWLDFNQLVKPAVHGLNLVARIISGTAQPVSIVATAADDSVVIPIVRSAPTSLSPGVEAPIFIDLPCVRMDGSISQSKVTVKFSFSGAPGDVSFNFTKICELPPINIGSPGPAGLDPDVVLEGVARSNFNYTSTSDVMADDFDLWIPVTPDHPGFAYWPYFNFTATDQPIVRWTNKNLITNVGLTLSRQSILPNTTGTETTKLKISYTCNNAVPAGSDTIYIILDIGFITKLQFQFTKNCSFGAGTGPATIFNALLVRNGDYAIRDGQVLGDWSKGIGQNIPQNEHEVDFQVYITAPTREGNLVLPFNVTAIVTNGGSHMMINEGSTEPTAYVARMINAPGYKQNLTVPMDITCKTTGEGTGTVIFDFGQQYDPLIIHFQYLCSQPYFNIDFMTQDGTSVIQRIVSRNVPQSWNYNSPNNNNFERFLVTLDNSTAYPVQDVTFDRVSYLDHVMKVQVTPVNQWIPLPKGDAGLHAQVLFQCLDSSKYTTSPVTIQLDYGWNNVQLISFYKTCGTAPPPSSSSGWSAAGIFFFTIFILTLVGCVSGAGYKYVKEEKRGWDVIPGITYYRSCYENACPAKRYTPQTDYYTDNVPDHGGKSYQTDL